MRKCHSYTISDFLEEEMFDTLRIYEKCSEEIIKEKEEYNKIKNMKGKK